MVSNTANQKIMVQYKELELQGTAVGLRVKSLQAEELACSGKLPRGMSSGQKLESGFKDTGL